MRRGQRCAQGTAADKCVPLTLDRLIGTAALLWWLDNYMQSRWHRPGHRSLAVQVKKQDRRRWCEWRHVENIKKWKQALFFSPSSVWIYYSWKTAIYIETTDQSLTVSECLGRVVDLFHLTAHWLISRQVGRWVIKQVAEWIVCDVQ